MSLSATMGGGMVLRSLRGTLSSSGASVGRAIGGAVSGSIVRNPCQVNFCDSCKTNSNKAGYALTKASSSCTCTAVVDDELASLPPPSGALGRNHSWEVDDWEFADIGGGSRSEVAPVISHESNKFVGGGHDEEEFPSHLVFGSVPSKDEVVSAVNDLQTTFSPTRFLLSHDGSVASNSSLESDEKDPHDVNSVQSPKFIEVDSEKSEPERSGDWTEPQLQPYAYSKELQSQSHRNVMQAVKLLQSNEDVQGMVVSLVSDQAIWDAVMKNEKVIQFRQQMEKADVKAPSDDEFSKYDSDDSFSKYESSDPLLKDDDHNESWWNIVKQKVFDYMEKISEIVQEVFRLGDKKNSEESSSLPGIDIAVKSSIVLSVLVMLIVMVKRV